MSKPLTPESKIFVAGHRGLVGSSILRWLQARGYQNVVVRTRQELDLEDQAAVFAFLEEQRFDAVVIAAAKVGGIHANSTYPADFIAQNMVIEHNLIWGSHLADVSNLVFLGSSCAYPRETAQPIPESALLTGPLEPTNAPYAVAKIAGIFLCDSIAKQYGRRYFTAIPPNIYGPYDNFDLKTSHVLPAVLRKVYEALPDKPVTIWGDGTPRREFMHCDDIADAVMHLLDHPDVMGIVNMGTGVSTSIRELVETIRAVVGHRGEIVWDTSMPNGFPEKTMDVSRLHSLGWHHRIDIEEGIRSTYDWYRENAAVPA